MAGYEEWRCRSESPTLGVWDEELEVPGAVDATRSSRAGSLDDGEEGEWGCMWRLMDVSSRGDGGRGRGRGDDMGRLWLIEGVIETCCHRARSLVHARTRSVAQSLRLCLPSRPISCSLPPASSFLLLSAGPDALVSPSSSFLSFPRPCIR